MDNHPVPSVKSGAKSRDVIIFAFVLAVVFVALVFAVYHFLPVHEDSTPPYIWGFSVDWKGVIRHDTLIFLEGKSPYVYGKGLMPPWGYLLLAPIAVFSKPVGAAIIFVLTYTGYTFTLHKMNAKLPALLAFLTCPLIWKNAWNGNIDWLPVIGFVLPAQIGLFFVLIKPQIGVGIAFYWLVLAWRKDKLREVIRIFSPVVLGYAISFLLYGFWPLRLVNMTEDAFNSSMWPYGIPLAIGLLWYGVKKNKANVAISASPFFAPYINIHSFAINLFLIYQKPVCILLVNTVLWVIFISMR